MKYIATVDGRDFTIDVDRPGEVVLDDQAHAVDLRSIDGNQLYSLILGNQSIELFVERREGRTFVLIAGDRYAVDVEDAHLKQLKAMGSQLHEEHGTVSVVAPMPGLVVRVMVEAGQAVAANQGLVLLEAMKMENEIRSPRDGVVKSVRAQPGATVSLGDLLVVVGAPE